MPSRRYVLGLAGTALTGCLSDGNGTPATRSASPSATATQSRTGTETETQTQQPHSPTETPLDPATPPSSVEGDWTHRLYDAGQTGFTPNGRGPAEQPGLVFSMYPATEPSTPVIAEETVYVGSTDRVSAIDAITGEPRWQRELDAGGNRVGSLTVAGSLLVAGVGTNAVGLNREDGSTEWSTAVGANASPVVGDRSVYVRDGNTLVSLTRETGTERWRRTIDDAEYLNRPAPVGDTVYLSNAASAGKVRALTTADGSTRWTASAGSHPTAVTVTDDRVYAGGYYGKVTCLASSDGEQRWASNAGPPVGRILAGPGRVYAQGSGGDVAIACLETGGTKCWTRPSGFPIAATADTLFVADERQLLAVDADSGDRTWAVEFDTDVRAGCVVDDLIYTTTSGVEVLR